MITRAGDAFCIPPWRHRGLMLWCTVMLFGIAPPMFILRVADSRWIGWLLITGALLTSAWNFFGTMTLRASSQTLEVRWRLFGITRTRRFSTVKSVRALERRLDRTRIFQGLAIDGHEIAIECSDEEILRLARELNDRLAKGGVMRLGMKVDSDGMRIVNPARRDLRVFAGLLLTAMAIAWLHVPFAGILIWGVAVRRLAWTIWGRELILLDAKTLVRSRQILGIGNWDTFDLEHISEIGLRTPTEAQFARFNEWRKVEGPRTIAFRYHGDDEALGVDLDEHEARSVIAAIEERLPKSDGLAR